MVGYILEEVDPDIIVQHCAAVAYTLLEIKLLYQQHRIRRYRFEPYRPIQNNRKDRFAGRRRLTLTGRNAVEKWHDEGLGIQAADENEYLNHWLETPGEYAKIF